MNRRVRSSRRTLVVSRWTLLLVFAFGAATAAQESSPGNTPGSPARAGDRDASGTKVGRWEIEIHIGAVSTGTRATGTGSLPGPGASFTTVVDEPSRHASSWYFGDGSVLLNAINSAAGAKGRVTPLDPVLTSAIASREPGGNYGIRLTRRLSDHFAAEFSVDYGRARMKMTSETLAGIEAARQSFASAIGGLLATGPFRNSSVSSVATIRDGASNAYDIIGTAALNVGLPQFGRADPYVTVGGGLIGHSGNSPSATLIGNYKFMIDGVVPVHETDTVNVRYLVSDRAFVTLVGGGLKYLVSPGWGVRLDLRAQLIPNRVATQVDASPLVAAGTPAGGIASVTAPSMQFSNGPLDGPSTLSGQTISGFETFKGNGDGHRTVLTFGVFWRF